MPIGTCDPASRSEALNAFRLDVIFPDSSGHVTAEVRHGWDGSSVRPDCDGQVTFLRTRNTHPTQPAWALLPDKRRGDLWVRIDPGTDVTVTAKGQLSNLGLSNAQDIVRVRISFTDPAG